jgi:hypothetical protein
LTTTSNLKIELEHARHNLIEDSADDIKRYFHWQTIDNLIYHFDHITIEDDKRSVHASIMSFISECILVRDIIDRKLSVRLWNKHLDKVTDYYSSNLGFHLVANQLVSFAFYLLLFLAGTYFFNLFIGLVPVAVFLIQSFLISRWRRERKAYCLFY